MKKIILTGCSKGIGKSITNNLLKNKFFVIGISRNSNNFIEKVKNDNKNFEHIEADLLDDNDLNKVLEVFDKHNLYGLINNAGVGLDGILATLPIKDIDKLISLNLRVPILLSRAMSRNIVKNKTTGRIINISSIISQNGYNGLSVYSATKSGLNGLTLSLARELGRTGTTVNAILPGYIKTDMTNKLSDKQLDQIVRRTPLGKLTDTDDVANIVEYLVSKKQNL